jgi:hypothetical protein
MKYIDSGKMIAEINKRKSLRRMADVCEKVE